MKLWILLVILSLTSLAAPARKVQFKVYPPNARISLITGTQEPHWPIEASGTVPEKFFSAGRGDLEFLIEDPKNQHQSVTVQVHKNLVNPGQTYNHPTQIYLKPIGLAVVSDWFIYPTWASYGLLLTLLLGGLAYTSRRSLSKIDRQTRRLEQEIREIEKATGSTLPPGKTHFDRIGDYYTTRVLGAGTFGEVKLGCHYRNRTASGLVAIKTPKALPLDPTDPEIKGMNEEQRAKYLQASIQEDEVRFERECRRQQELNHPNVIRVLDYGRNEAGPYLVMEFFPAINFGEYLKNKGVLSLKEAGSYFSQICDGLYAVHQKGIIHRDIKPENMLWADGKLKITDFGTARRTINESGFLTGFDAEGRPEKIQGTPFFLAPEALSAYRGTGTSFEKLSNPAMDQYAVGVTLYQMLTGTLPRTQLIEIFSELDISPITTHRDDLNPRLVQGVHRMLEFNPEERYPNLKIAKESLLEFLR